MRGDAQQRRVAITGLGCVTSLGFDLPESWEALLAGRSGVRSIPRLREAALPVQIAAPVLGDLPLPGVPEKERRRLDRFTCFALAATAEAFASARLARGDFDGTRAGAAIGSGIGGILTLTENHRALLAGGPRRVSPFGIPMCIANMASGLVAIHFGLRGPNFCTATACASGAHAIGQALDTIRSGAADLMLAGGAEAPICDFVVAGFARMRALSTRNEEPERASRPFDAGRDGFVIGEGAGALVLEEWEHARARGAPIRAELVGYASTADAEHIVEPTAEGDGPRRCMENALLDAGLAPGDVDYVNAHATSTPAGDRAEARALQQLFGTGTSPWVSSTKSSLGHSLGASGAVEAALTVMALETGWLPPTLNLERPDETCALNHVAEKARKTHPNVAISNSFGFGGTNVTLVLKHG